MNLRFLYIFDIIIVGLYTSTILAGCFNTYAFLYKQKRYTHHLHCLYYLATITSSTFRFIQYLKLAELNDDLIE